MATRWGSGGFANLRIPFGGPRTKDRSTQGFILGSPMLRKLPSRLFGTDSFGHAERRKKDSSLEEKTAYV